MMTLGDRVKKIRGDLTQKDFSAQFGVTADTLRRYETDKNPPDANFLVGLCEYYKVNPTWLLTGEGPMHLEPRHREAAMDQAKHLLLGDKEAARRRNERINDAGRLVRAAEEATSQVWHQLGADALPDPQTELEKRQAETLAGVKEMYKAAEFSRLAGEQQADKLADDDFVKIPRYEVAASAGGGAVIHSEQIVDHLSFKAEWVKNALGVSVAHLALINVIGDSMEPTLSEGDVVLLDMSTRDIVDSSIYALQLNGGLLVKRIQRCLDGSLVVMSDNPRYTQETLTADQAGTLKIVGRVVWVGRRL